MPSCGEGQSYAMCETNHPYWTGPCRDAQDDAQNDATAHDNAAHGGEETAIVTTL